MVASITNCAFLETASSEHWAASSRSGIKAKVGMLRGARPNYPELSRQL